MEQNIRIRLLESIGKIYEESKDCKLEPAFFETVENDLNVLSDYFGISNTQSLLVAMIFSLNYNGDTVDFNDLTEYFDCNPMKLLEYSSDFENLYSKGIFIKEKSRHRIKLALSNDQFTINEKVTEAILNNMPLPKLGDEEVGDVFEFLENIYKIGERRDGDEISTNELLLQSIQLVNSNLHFPLIKMVNDYNFKPEDTFVYLYLIWKTICGNELVDLNTMVEGVFDKPTRRIQYVQKIMSNENTLIRNGLIEIVEARFLNDTGIKLSDKSCKLIEECGVKLLTKKKTDQNNTIAPNQIFTKNLFYNDAEA